MRSTSTARESLERLAGAVRPPGAPPDIIRPGGAAGARSPGDPPGAGAGGMPAAPAWLRAGPEHPGPGGPGADGGADGGGVGHGASGGVPAAVPAAGGAAAGPHEVFPGGWAGRLPERWRGARVAVGRRGAAGLALVGLLAAVAAGVGVLHDRPAAVRVPAVDAAAAESGAGAESAEGAGAGAQPPGPAAAAGTVAAGVPAPATSTAQGGAERAAAAPEEIVVSVQGLVHHSGLFHLDAGARVADALDAAGGPAERADLLSLNLAQRLADGDQVLVGVAAADGGPPRLGSATISAAGGGAAGQGQAAPGTAAGPAGGAVDLNTADQAALEALPGIGPVTAAAILEWRAANGRFTSVDQLTEVKGIGPATLADLRESVTV